MRKHSLLLLLLAAPAWLAPAQSDVSSGDLIAADSAASVAAARGFLNPQFAMSNAGYRVTAGDVYTLAYAAGGAQVTYPIAVDASYRVRVSNLGVVNAAGKTFLQLKAEAEAIVSNNYPLSGAQLVLTSPALFTVHLRGEVSVAAEQPAWALSRLSSLLAGGRLTPYASLRDVTVTSGGGQARVYDIFRAQRDGDLGQDPYLRPGDTVTVGRVRRTVAVQGAVERPGRYQMLEGEGLGELVTRYGGGLTPLADASRAELVRRVGGSAESGEKIFLSAGDMAGGFALNDLDEVYVPLIADLMPVMFAEGAVQLGSEEGGAALSGANRVTVRFNEGENYASLVRRNRGWFSAVSDTRNAYLLRGGERIGMNLNPMLYDSGYRSAYYVEGEDTLVVPFRQYFVTVAGAVLRPGRYPYIPDRTWDYYIAMAGGFDPVRNMRESVEITELGGRRLGKGDEVTPETIITARTNGALYYFNQVAPVITTTLSIASTFVSIYLLVTR
ncbi:MAG: SLBB domain-containing protein [Treponema sp.]|jgi:protein involved in polysaccharide export with SLBB domain|nr:SLBB domain-containing protein [Treponema sp.]